MQAEGQTGAAELWGGQAGSLHQGERLRVLLRGEVFVNFFLFLAKDPTNT